MTSDRAEASTLRDRVRTMMEQHWTPWGYTVPHAARYPFQWLWDSCFHAIIWAELGDERAVTELASVFRHQTPSGLVPHVTYDAHPTVHADFWGRPGTSTITQPPMFGHAAAELGRRGFAVPDRTLEQASRGLRFLLDRRPRIDGLVPLCHPWESGADDSPRWDHWFAPTWDAATRYQRKGKLVASLVLDDEGAAITNPGFMVASAGFNALVAFNAAELASVTADDALAGHARELAERLDARWDPTLETWTDATSTPSTSSTIRTADSLLPLLVIDRPISAALLDPRAYGTPFGPAGVHTAEATYDPGAYWRGSTWPQITYLLAVAASRRSNPKTAGELERLLQAGATRSGLAEHWHAQEGTALGSAPQSWTGLAIVRQRIEQSRSSGSCVLPHVSCTGLAMPGG